LGLPFEPAFIKGKITDDSGDEDSWLPYSVVGTGYYYYIRGHSSEDKSEFVVPVKPNVNVVFTGRFIPPLFKSHTITAPAAGETVDAGSLEIIYR
jgi:hypothetical protein